MKFGKKIRSVIEESDEEWRPNFMNYKILKKYISHKYRLSASSENLADESQSKDDSDSRDNDELIELPLASSSFPDNDGDLTVNAQAVRQAEKLHSDFFTSFRHEVDKVNDFFLDKQEDFIIYHRQLLARVEDLLKSGCATRQQVHKLRVKLTNFHGELVVLENFSTVNYTGFRKILKKHDKKTGLNVQHIYLNTVLITPFFLSDTVRRLVLSTEAMLARLDTIVKFRRPAMAVLDAPLIDHEVSKPPQRAQMQQSQHTPGRKNMSLTNSQIPANPSDMPNTSHGLSSPLRPRAFVASNSALWRLYRDAHTHANDVHCNSLQSPPPTRLIRLVDAISPNELGITPDFLAAVSIPSLYVIAHTDDLSIGFVVLPPGTSLQIYRASCCRTLVLRNVRGCALLRVFRCNAHLDDDGNKSNVDCDHEEENAGIELKLERSGLTTGPWPAIVANSDNFTEWSAKEPVALFYVAIPPFNESSFPKFTITTAGDSFHARRDRGNDSSLLHVMC